MTVEVTEEEYKRLKEEVVFDRRDRSWFYHTYDCVCGGVVGENDNFCSECGRKIRIC